MNTHKQTSHTRMQKLAAKVKVLVIVLIALTISACTPSASLPTPTSDICVELKAELDTLEISLRDWQDQLDTAPPPPKADIVDQIKKINDEIAKITNQLSEDCYSLPNLVPVSPIWEGGVGPYGQYCGRVEDPDRHIGFFIIENNGQRDAPASLTTITFTDAQLTTDIPTPLIEAGGSTQVSFEIPDSCWVGEHDSDCYIDITIDARDDVKEIPDHGERDNQTNGYCSTIG